MARPLRELSPTGIYHVMLRGVNKQRIFEDTEDYNAFVRILRKCLLTDKWGNKLDEPNFDLYAYCLMDNHVHLLIATRIISISDVVKRIASTYARVFNERYQRVGHFFQDRFKSEIVCDEDYFYHLMSYIHRNPIEANICSFPDEYPFSSFRELTEELHNSLPLVSDPNTPKLCNLSNIQDRIGSITPDTIYAYLTQLNNDLHHIDDCMARGIDPYPDVFPFVTPDNLEYYPEILLQKLNQSILNKADKIFIDQLITEALLVITDQASISDFQRLEKVPMREALSRLRGAGVSIRKLSRISGISEGIIRYCTPIPLPSNPAFSDSE